ncbi:MAG: hypothetical protein FWC15_08020 [Fibromonadales bacterium]|nr:hypothetical protein [Fibromonadales bacterium]
MFTFKKYALLGAAGLAALAMSCSDSDDEVGSATWTTAFGVTDGTPVTLSGVITPATGITVDGLAITATAGTKVQTITFNAGAGNAPTLPAESVTLTGKAVGGFCDGLSGAQTFNVKIVAVLSDASKLEGAASVAITCPGGAGPTGAWEFTLSNGGTSYADIDGQKTYTRTNALSDANIDAIDLIAFESGAGNNIVTPFFYTDFAGKTDGALIWLIPSSQQANALSLINAATTDDAKAALKTMLNLIYDEDQYEVDEVEVAANTVFIVETTEVDVYAVVITAANTTTKTVTMKAYFVQ